MLISELNRIFADICTYVLEYFIEQWPTETEI